MKRKQEDPRTGNGSVSANEVMTLREFGRRLGLGQRSCSDAQRQGLRTVLFGRCKFVVGEDVVAWFRRLAQDKDGMEVDSTVHTRHQSDKVDSEDRPVVPQAVHDLEDELKDAITEVVHHLGLKKLPLLPSGRTMEMMAKAATAVYEAVVEDASGECDVPGR